MRFDQFLTALDHALGLSDPGVNGISLRVSYDPLRKAAASNEILIGVGVWFADGNPVLHHGICLNNKGLSRFAETEKDHGSVTELVINPPASVATQWQESVGRNAALNDLLARFTLVVEDISPDSCFGLLCWLALQCGVDRRIFVEGPEASWVTAVRHWESTGTSASPFNSWAALLSSLSHSFIPPADIVCSPELAKIDFSNAWRQALAFTVELLKRQVAPDAVPALWHLDAYTRAATALNAEYQDYEQTRDHAETFQLLIPLSGTHGTRKLLVDAYFAVEPAPSGAKKTFIRIDRDHTFFKQGFAVMGLHRPGKLVRGSGADMTVSVNPNTGIYLQDLWQELERLENERWGGCRPTEHARLIASYAGSPGYTEPWWDDYGRYTLLAAPRMLSDGTYGSRLDWNDVMAATWSCYNPVKDVIVNDVQADNAAVRLHSCTRTERPFESGAGTAHKRFVAVRSIADSSKPQSIVVCPTARRVFAAIISRERQGSPVEISELPKEQFFDFVSLEGGFALIHRCGALIHSDWRDSGFHNELFRDEFDRTVGLLGEVLRINKELDRLLHVAAKARKSSAHWVMVSVARLRVALSKAKQKYATVSHHGDVRRFRNTLEQRWGMEKAVEDLYKRAAEIEESQRTLTALQTRDLMAWISTYGLPFIIIGTVTNYLAPWIESCWPGGPGAKAFAKIGLYLVLSLALILVLVRIQRRRSESEG